MITKEQIDKAVSDYENSTALPDWDNKLIHGVDFRKGIEWALLRKEKERANLKRENEALKKENQKIKCLMIACSSLVLRVKIKDARLKIYLKEKWKAFDDDKGYLDEGIRRSLIEEIYRELFNETINEL